MNFKRFFIVAVYAYFVLLNIVPVHACDMPNEDRCCSSSCCADEPMDCCEIEDDQSNYSYDHAINNPLIIKKVIYAENFIHQNKSEVVHHKQTADLVTVERPPPLRVKRYIANQQLVLYA